MGAAEDVGEHPTRRLLTRVGFDKWAGQALRERCPVGIAEKADIERDRGVVLALPRGRTRNQPAR
jgi:hypothetical protein